MLGLLEAATDDRVDLLDFACGTGELLRHLDRLGGPSPLRLCLSTEQHVGRIISMDLRDTVGNKKAWFSKRLKPALLRFPATSRKRGSS
jgi:hypothetical protein